MNSHTATDVADWLRLRIHEFNSRFNSRENERNEDEDEDEDS